MLPGLLIYQFLGLLAAIREAVKLSSMQGFRGDGADEPSAPVDRLTRNSASAMLSNIRTKGTVVNDAAALDQAYFGNHGG